MLLQSLNTDFYHGEQANVVVVVVEERASLDVKPD